jgi:hypothetical protein
MRAPAMPLARAARRRDAGRGPGAAACLHNETRILARLAGVAGVPQLRTAACEDIEGPTLAEAIAAARFDLPAVLALARRLALLAVLRASQALSSETSLARLEARIIELLGALTGATSVRVLLWRDDPPGWTLSGDGDVMIADEAASRPSCLAPASARRAASPSASAAPSPPLPSRMPAWPAAS